MERVYLVETCTYGIMEMPWSRAETRRVGGGDGPSPETLWNGHYQHFGDTRLEQDVNQTRNYNNLCVTGSPGDCDCDPHGSARSRVPFASLSFLIFSKHKKSIYLVTSSPQYFSVANRRRVWLNSVLNFNNKICIRLISCLRVVCLTLAYDRKEIIALS